MLEREIGRAFTHEHRHYLAGEPVHCGEILERYKDGEWIRGRYEWTARLENAPTFEHANGAVFFPRTICFAGPNWHRTTGSARMRPL
jgi:hypothetical protein